MYADASGTESDLGARMAQEGTGPVSVLVSVEEAAAMLGVGRTAAWRLVYEGQLPSAKIGSRRLVPVAGVHELAARLVDEARSPR